MTQEQLLFASLVGSKLVKLVPRLEVLENKLGKHVLPKTPFLPFQNTSNVFKAYGFEALDASENMHDSKLSEAEQFFPLSLSIDNEKTWFLLPWEPMISVSGKNNIIRRHVAKFNPEHSKNPKGSIKERWSQDDYSITITGFLFGKTMTGSVEETFPKADFELLRKVLTHAKEVRVKSPLFEILEIHKIVIEDFTFPFSKGENVQAYEIKAFSDDTFKLIIPSRHV